MLEDALLWIGLAGLIGGVAVGLSLLESEGDPFLRNIMLSAGIACVMFIYLLILGEKTPWSPILFLISAFVGGTAALIVAFAAHANLRAASVAGGTAGMTLQVLVKILPPESFGFTGLHDVPTAIDIFATILVVVGVYYLLRNWGKDGEKWD